MFLWSIYCFLNSIVNNQHSAFHSSLVQLDTLYKTQNYDETIFNYYRRFTTAFGPSCCGRIELNLKVLLQNTFSLKFEYIFYYHHDQPKFVYFERKTYIKFIMFSSFENTSKLDDYLMEFDDFSEVIF